MHIDGAFSEGVPHISKHVLNIWVGVEGGVEKHLGLKLDMWHSLQNNYVKGGQNVFEIISF